MSFPRIAALFIAILSWANVTRGNVPIIIPTGTHQRAVMKLCSDASHQLRNGDVAGAKRNVDAALRIDPKLWPALYVRAQIFRKEGKYELAFRIAMKRFGNIQDVSRRPCCGPASMRVSENMRKR